MGSLWHFLNFYLNKSPQETPKICKFHLVVIYSHAMLRFYFFRYFFGDAKFVILGKDRQTRLPPIGA